jgi:glycosyltransferase involved in cell wall biosynthesis
MTPRLAYFSPLNPIQSGISDYSEDLLPWLSAWAEIDLFVDGFRPTNPALNAYTVHDVRRFPALAKRYDAVIYQMGNSPAHAAAYRMLQRHTGVVVLHEHVLHHLISWMSWDRGDARLYLDEFRYCYGAEGAALARRIITGRERADFFDYPLSDRAIRAARGIVVHSDLVRQAVLRVRPDAPLAVAPMGVPLPPAISGQQAAARQRLGLSPDALVIGSFGHITPFKRLDVALRAFRVLLQAHPGAVYILVGSVSPNYDVTQTIRLLGLGDSVRLVGYADAAAFNDHVAATDVCINLRHPTAGETSASVLRLMGAGLPVLVSRTGTFEELPDAACIKIDTDDAEGKLVLEYLRLLADNSTLRQRIGENARRFVATEHSMEKASQGYLDALRSWYPRLSLPERAARPVHGPGSVPDTDQSRRSGRACPAPSGIVPDTKKRHDAAGISPLEANVLDIVANAAADLGLGDEPQGLTDAARAWSELGRTR